MACRLGFDVLLGFLVLVVTIFWIAERRER
jgi:hypothetical protein